MHDHIIKEELSSITLPITLIIIKQATLECVSVVTSTLEHILWISPYSKVVITSFRGMKARQQLKIPNIITVQSYASYLPQGW